MRFTKDKTLKFEKVGIKGWVYLGRKESPDAGVCLVETEKGHETVIKSTKNTWIYFVIEGKGYFMIDGKKISCKKEDVIVVPKDKPFYYQGKLKMLLITVPAWEEKYEVTLGRMNTNRGNN